jgi:CheY-like chemotaxis protein/HPt (histidine-containing phosphotransfer) domain-containing protein
VAILDMQMPEMDGETLGRMIRDDHSLDQTALVMMTSVGSRGDAARLHRAGFAAYLTKPVKQSQLFDCLVTVLHRETSSSISSEEHIVTRHSLADQAKRRTRLLLAEDNLVNQKVALAMLDRLGYRADVVGNGREAVAALEAEPYDLVLMDVQMPEMDGFEAVACIRDPKSRVVNRAIPIVALTAHAMTGDKERCLAAGMDDYLSKPLDPEQLRCAIQRWTAVQDGSTGDPAHSPGSPGLENAFDPTVLKRMLGDDEELARSIIDEFLSDAGRQVEALGSLIGIEDRDQMRRQAHTLKGASASVGARALQEGAALLEAEAKAEPAAEPALMGERVAEIRAAFDEFKLAVERFGCEEVKACGS